MVIKIIKSKLKNNAIVSKYSISEIRNFLEDEIILGLDGIFNEKEIKNSEKNRNFLYS